MQNSTSDFNKTRDTTAINDDMAGEKIKELDSKILTLESKLIIQKLKVDNLNKEIEDINMDHNNKTEVQETTIANLQSILKDKKMLDERKDLD